MKRVPARRTRGRSLEPEDLDPTNEDHAGTALYAAHQTTLYCAPPVVNGRIPKNVYGNLDLYVLSMVPPGGAHIPHPETSRAARILGIDYADAVTGFSFRGRHGTAVIKGAVVASEYREAVEAVIQAFEDERTQAEEQRRSLEALRMWKRLLAGLRIRQRIKGYKIEGEPDAAMQEVMEKVDDDEDEDEGGGFLPDLDREECVQPTGGRSQAQNLPDAVEDEHGGFLTKDMESEPERQPTADATEWRPTDRFIDSFDDDDGGGFLINDGDADAEDALRDAKDNDHELATESRDSSSRERIVQKAALQGEATLNLPQDELEEARLLQQLYEAEDTTVSNAPDNKPATRPDQQSTSPPRSGPITEEPVKSESSDSEMGSLLSHDPDDEDADPEWIT